MYSDPLEDSVKTSQKGFNDINNALNSSLDDKSPFGYDKKTEALTYDNSFDRESFNGKQLEKIDRFAESVTSEDHHINVFKVDIDAAISDLRGLSLRDRRATGATVLKTQTIESKTNFVTGSTQNVYYSGNPIKIENGKSVAARSWYKGITILHELGGHVYENITNPYLGKDYQNINVENFEQNIIRTIYSPTGIPVGGFGDKHQRSKGFKEY